MKSCLVKVAFKHTKKAATDSLHHYPISLKCKTSETVIHNNQSKWSLPASYASSAPQHAGPQLGRAKRTTPKATCGQQNHMIVVEFCISCVSSCKANTTSLHLSQERGGKSTHSYSQSEPEFVMANQWAVSAALWPFNVSICWWTVDV